MVTSLKKTLFVCLLLSGCITNVSAQDWELGLGGGMSGYMGELNQDNPLNINDWTIGLLIRKNLSRHWAVRMNFIRANVQGDASSNSNEHLQQQKLYFKTSLYEASIVGEFNFFKFEPSYNRVSYTPYLFVGVGGFHFQPKNYNFDGDLVNLHPYQTEGVTYNRFEVSVPFGIGFRYNLKGPWSVGVEFGYRVAFTDYLDDISGSYISAYDGVPERYALGNEALAQRRYFIDPSYETLIGTQRGDGRKRDAYMLANFTLTYAIFRAGCPIYIKGN
ncbi:outer membrane beta-barrel protein [Olivibacter sp. SDN3]|uniref:type IX secretion system protein PorG n=1 Tax=Olivibacter sp. SDN3 TaxID=2764720 RepID=UPI0016512534|nr:DUF6089 family protein [Olivibacter sp. SDN3]QNL50002.1 outer membrane beta-barrel protein [Olivibacter sp. SDN3]